VRVRILQLAIVIVVTKINTSFSFPDHEKNTKGIFLTKRCYPSSPVNNKALSTLSPVWTGLYCSLEYVAKPTVMADRCVGRNSGPIFLRLWTKVHLVMSSFLVRHCSLQCMPFSDLLAIAL